MYVKWNFFSNSYFIAACCAHTPVDFFGSLQDSFFSRKITRADEALYRKRRILRSAAGVYPLVQDLKLHLT